MQTSWAITYSWKCWSMIGSFSSGRRGQSHEFKLVWICGTSFRGQNLVPTTRFLTKIRRSHSKDLVPKTSPCDSNWPLGLVPSCVVNFRTSRWRKGWEGRREGQGMRARLVCLPSLNTSPFPIPPPKTLIACEKLLWATLYNCHLVKYRDIQMCSKQSNKFMNEWWLELAYWLSIGCQCLVHRKRMLSAAIFSVQIFVLI